MNVKQKFRGIVILVLLIFWIASTLSGLILYFSPEGRRAGWTVIFGFQKRDWIQIHSWVSFLAVVITTLHIILEWPIFVALVKQLFKREE